MLVYQRLDSAGEPVSMHIVRDGEVLLLLAGETRAQVSPRVLETIMRRYGRELDPSVEVDGESIELDTNLRLQRFRFHARVDADGRDYLALIESGAPPLAALATTVAGALEHLLAS
jgi:hypothetical protein